MATEAAAPASAGQAKIASSPVQVLGTLALDAVVPNTRLFVPHEPFTARLVRGGFVPPAAGERFDPAAPTGSGPAWRSASIDADGTVRDEGVAKGGTLYIALHSQREQVLLLDARAIAWVWIDGSLRAGDIYNDGTLRLPVLLRAGVNHVLLRGGRGQPRLQWHPAPPAPFLHDQDFTLPDMVEAGFDGERFHGAANVINPTPHWTPRLRLRARTPGAEAVVTEVDPIAPLAHRKVPFQFEAQRIAPEQHFGLGLPLDLELLGEGFPAGTPAAPAPGTEAVSTRTVQLPIKRPLDARRVTFVSALDGSVQYYGLRPATGGMGERGSGLIVALHGASVEAVNITERYRNQPWAHIVAPTNRRPFGFNWEEWGARDLFEVLADAQARLAPDPQRIWLKGHSMGGHGTWINGTQQADRFAAIAPIAGWSHIWSYAKAPRPDDSDPVSRIVRRAGNSGDPYVTLPNLAQRGVFVKHPAQDESVPLAEAESMVAALKPWHRDLEFLVRPGISHWPDHSVMEWPPLMDFLRARSRVSDREQREFSFVTVDPSIAHRMAFVEVHAQQVMLAPSRVQVRFDPAQRRLALGTENVARLRIDLKPLRAEPALLAPGALRLELDGQVLQAAVDGAAREIWLARQDAASGQGPWQLAGPPDALLKSPARGSRILAALNHQALIVVGTQGSEAERVLLLDQARYLAELFTYRGNASLRVVRDDEFLAGGFAGRNVVLLGNAQTNSAWQGLLGDSPVQVQRGRARVGMRALEGDDVALAFVRPRPAEPVAAVIALAATGPTGVRLLQRLPLLPATAGLADWIVMDGRTLDAGPRGIVGTGFFDNAWRLSAEQSGWAAAPPATGPAPAKP